MKTNLLLLVALLTVSLAKGQNFVEASVGASYAKQYFYDIDNNTGFELGIEDWDLAFSTIGLQDAGIHVNEAAIFSFTTPATEVEVYYTGMSDFSMVTAAEDTSYVRLYNDESNWGNGALNVNRSAVNPLDYGWGSYNPMSRIVVGAEVFVVKLRSGAYLKLMIENLNATVYNIKYANLDGTEEKTVQIDKANFPGGLALFSFTTGATIDADVSGVDLIFTRYTTPLPDTTTAVLDDTLNYNVTGVLSGIGTEVIEVAGVDTADVVLTSDMTFSTQLDEIGYDWKTFTGQWFLPKNLSYIVKTGEGKTYKVIYDDFEGFTTGVTVMVISEISVVSNTNQTNRHFDAFTVAPNPTSGDLNVTYALKQASPQQVMLSLYNNLGQSVWNARLNGSVGNNNERFQLPAGLPTGHYYLRIQTGPSQLTKKISIH
ncbi:MAG: HmuY family protein [Bacteroidota bacterium]